MLKAPNWVHYKSKNKNNICLGAVYDECSDMGNLVLLSFYLTLGWRLIARTRIRVFLNRNKKTRDY